MKCETFGRGENVPVAQFETDACSHVVFGRSLCVSVFCLFSLRLSVTAVLK